VKQGVFTVTSNERQISGGKHPQQTPRRRKKKYGGGN
jgi:hypothetical protein